MLTAETSRAKGVGMVFKALSPIASEAVTSSGNVAMKPQDFGLNLGNRRTRKAMFLDGMNLVVPWSKLLSLISPHAPRATTGQQPFELETMLRIHFVRHWFGLSDLFKTVA